MHIDFQSKVHCTVQQTSLMDIRMCSDLNGKKEYGREGTPRCELVPRISSCFSKQLHCHIHSLFKVIAVGKASVRHLTLVISKDL